MMVLLGLSLVLFVAGLVMEHVLSDSFAFIPYLLAYVIVGWDVAKQVVIDLRQGEEQDSQMLPQLCERLLENIYQPDQSLWL